MNHGQLLTSERVLAHQLKVRVQVFGAGELPLAQLFERALHRIERVSATGQNAVFHRFMDGFRQFLPAQASELERFSVRRQTTDGHSVRRQCASLVDAQHGD